MAGLSADAARIGGSHCLLLRYRKRPDLHKRGEDELMNTEDYNILNVSPETFAFPNVRLRLTLCENSDDVVVRVRDCLRAYQGPHIIDRHTRHSHVFVMNNDTQNLNYLRGLCEALMLRTNVLVANTTGDEKSDILAEWQSGQLDVLISTFVDGIDSNLTSCKSSSCSG